MNERMLELYRQAQVPHTAIDPSNNMLYETTTFSAEKFAELIVAECMSTVLKESKWYWDKDEFESSNAIQNAARRLKEHFGVEE